MRISALIKRIMLEMFRDKRTLALLFLAPMLILTLMYSIFNEDSAKPVLGVKDVDAQLVEAFEKANIEIEEIQQATEQTVIDKNLDAMLAIENGRAELTLQNDDPSQAKALRAKVEKILISAMQPEQALSGRQPALEATYLYGDEDTGVFDVFSPILIGFFVFLFVFLISGIGLLRERTTGTLERLMSTPIRRFEIITGYLVGYGIFAIIQTILVVLYAVNVLGIMLVGSIGNVLLVNVIVAFVALSLGILLSTFANSEFQMMQFIPLVAVPQVFLCGIFPLDGMADWLAALGKLMPMYYAGDALKGVMYKGYGLSDISIDLIILLIFAAVFIILNIFALKKYRAL
ncbi:MAG: ABC transporter permease [Bacillus sp. (in: firmicutes)]